ncbi:RNA polymerase subunit sigma [Streptomyces sp. NPDC090080]|uniref:RNA polymerase subunit sigma n=1 Tax=Streptomyces sp. NPDC090080 TaxID=3365939 RepID=UPI003807A52A
MDSVDDVMSIAEMVEERRHLTAVAHRMLGSRAGAGSVVDEVYRRWYGLSARERARIVRPLSWLVTSTGHICLARLAAGPSNPPDGPPPGRPGEARNVRHRVLGTTPDAHSAVVGKPEPEREREREWEREWERGGPGDRARHSLRARRARPTAPQEHDAVSGALRDACVTQAPEALAALLAPDVSVSFDGGGKVRTRVRSVHGSRQVARSLLTLLAPQPRTTLNTGSVNGRTGLVAHYDREIAAVLTLDVAAPYVVQVWVTLNPDKLRSWT